MFSHRVHATALSGAVPQAPGDCGGETSAGVGDFELPAAEPAVGDAAEEHRTCHPFTFVLTAR